MDCPNTRSRTPRDLVRRALEAGIEAAHPQQVISEHVALDDDVLSIAGQTYDLGKYERVILIGGGNAGGHVATALESVLGESIDDGVVVTDETTDTDVVCLREGDHPVPSARNVEGATQLLQIADDADEETLVLCVVTGGGSALLAAPAGDVSLAAIQQLTGDLLASGASIDEINTVRKHLSELKGGRLARRLAPATTVGILLSDVTSNDPSIIASGPLAPDESTFERARSILEDYSISPPESVDEHLRAGAAGDRPETPAGDDPAFRSVDTFVLADGFTAVSAAGTVCENHDVETVLLSASIRGEAREAAKTHAAIAEEIVATGNPVEPPAAVVSGGETTVTLSDGGDGGPNQEFALGAALELPAGVVLGAVDTDGIDGSTTAAGAIVTAGTAEPADAARDALVGHDSFPFLDQQGATVETGPTGTNVNDLRVLFVPGTDRCSE